MRCCNLGTHLRANHQAMLLHASPSLRFAVRSIADVITSGRCRSSSGSSGRSRSSSKVPSQLNEGRVVATATGLRCMSSSVSSPHPTDVTPRPLSPSDLTDWIKRSGGTVSGLTVVNLAGRDGGSGWGLKADREAGPGTQLLDLPSACHLTYNAADSPQLLKLIEAVPSELWGAKLALQLLSHRLQGPGSPLSTYVSSLPIGVAGIPMFFPRESIAALEYPPVTEQVKKRCKWLYEFSTTTLAKLPGSADDPFSGARVDINALDMVNHSFDPNVEVRPTGAGIGLFAKQPLSAGDLLLLSYGNLTNDYLLMDYGFVMSDNPYDRVQLRFGTELVQAGAMVANVELNGEPLEIKCDAWQHSLLAQLRLEGPGADTEVTFGGPQHVDARLLAGTRVLMAQSEEEVKGRGLERLGQLDQSLSHRNERAVLRSLSGVAAFTLSRFSTTLDEDEQTLLSGLYSSGTPGRAAVAAAAPSPGQQHETAAGPPIDAVPLTDDMRLAIRFRVEKKRILSRAIQAMGQQLQALSKATSSVPEHSTAPRKGQAPPAATNKGFGRKPK